MDAVKVSTRRATIICAWNRYNRAALPGMVRRQDVAILVKAGVMSRPHVFVSDAAVLARSLREMSDVLKGIGA